MSVYMPGDLHAETAVTAEPELVERGQAFAEFMGHHRACLMRGHGVTTGVLATWSDYQRLAEES